MKIQSLLTPFAYREPVRRKDAAHDGDGLTPRDDGRGSPKREASEGDEEERAPADFESVANELRQFSEENAAHLPGISASVEGAGPGLRVTLKDGDGTVVRQISGEEFLEMRVNGRASGRGQLLDRKF